MKRNRNEANCLSALYLADDEIGFFCLHLTIPAESSRKIISHMKMFKIEPHVLMLFHIFFMGFFGDLNC